MQHSGQMSQNNQNPKDNTNTTSQANWGGKELSEKNDYKSVKIALLLSNVIDTNHQNSSFFTNKSHFLSPLLALFVF